MRAASRATGSRVAKSYTIEPDIDSYVSTTKGKRSASERVNELLKRAIVQEQQEEFDREAARFFAGESNRAGDTGRAETKAFQKAARRVLERD